MDGYGFNTMPEPLTDYIGMYMDFGCLFEPRDAGKVITSPPDGDSGGYRGGGGVGMLLLDMMIKASIKN